MKAIKRFIAMLLLLPFLMATAMPAALASEMPWMPQPGTMVALTPAFMPSHLRGMVIHPNDPFKFDFIVYRGDQQLTNDQKQVEYSKLIKYFLASLAIPDEDQWVNLSPYEKDRIIPDNYGLTEMGRDVLAQDYMLKQISASLSNPDTDLGRKFWDAVYEKSYQKFGTTNIPTDTFNKVWIIPDKAVIFEKGSAVVVLEHHLKVMLETDYLAQNSGEIHARSPMGKSPLQPGQHGSGIVGPWPRRGAIHESPSQKDIAKQVMREVILPAIEKEVNEGKNFAPLRQIHNSMLLAAWYKRALKGSILTKVYGDRARVKGIDQDPKTNQEIFDQYTTAFKKGVFNMINEGVNRFSQEVIPRKYFSGGDMGPNYDQAAVKALDNAETSKAVGTIVGDSDRVETVLTVAAAMTADHAQMNIAADTKGILSSVMSAIYRNALNARRTDNPLTQANEASAKAWVSAFEDFTRQLEMGMNSGYLKREEALLSLFAAREFLSDPTFAVDWILGSEHDVARRIQRTAPWADDNIAAKAAALIQSPANGIIVTRADIEGVSRQSIDSQTVWFKQTMVYLVSVIDILSGHLRTVNASRSKGMGDRLLGAWMMLKGRKPLLKVSAAALTRSIQDGTRGMLDSVGSVVFSEGKGQAGDLLKRFRSLPAILDGYVQRGNAAPGELAAIVALARNYLALPDVTSRSLVGETGVLAKKILVKTRISAKRNVAESAAYLLQMYGLDFIQARSDIEGVARGHEEEGDPWFLRTKNDLLAAFDIIGGYCRSEFVTNNPGLGQRTGAAFAVLIGRDAAMSDAASAVEPLRGGIDFAQSNLDMQIKRDGNGVPLPVSRQDLENIRIDGLVPVILSIQPAANMPLFN